MGDDLAAQMVREMEHAIGVYFESFEVCKIKAIARRYIEKAADSPYCTVCGSCGDRGCGCTHKCTYAFEHPDVSARIEALSAEVAAQAEEIERLRAALEPFAHAANLADERMIGRYGQATLPDDTTMLNVLNLNLGHVRSARAALKAAQEVQS